LTEASDVGKNFLAASKPAHAQLEAAVKPLSVGKLESVKNQMTRKESLQRLEIETQIDYVEQQIQQLQMRRSELLSMLKDVSAKKG
jgi:hypothetical protein